MKNFEFLIILNRQWIIMASVLFERTVLSMDSQIKAEDTVEYWLYPNSDVQASEILAFVLSLSQDYIWHDECFRLAERDLPCRHFYGSTHYGENSNDELFIVYLLLQLTIKYSDIVLRVTDADGDFLLIEAEKFLPRWVNPKSVENRIFLHNGALHIIPRRKDVKTMDLPETISLAHLGAEIVRSIPHITVADSSLQLCMEAIEKKFDTQECLARNFHFAYCFLPVKLALILNERPNLVSAAIQAFYLRDPSDVKACRECKYFSGENLVLRRVKFTKHLFAMLSGQKFFPDRKSMWKLPFATDSSFKWHTLGYKLTCGFEILCSRATTSTAKATIVNDNDVYWTKFVDNLERNGYFQGMLKGSAGHKDLTDKAASFYLDQVVNASDTPNYGNVILDMIKNLNVDDKSTNLIKGSESLLPEDDDGWLNITPDMLDATLEQKESNLFDDLFGNTKRNNIHQAANGVKAGLRTIKETLSQEVTNFVESKGSWNGVKFTSRSMKNGKANESGASNGESSMQHMLDLHIPESSSDSSDMDSYGEESNDEETIDVDGIKSSLAEMKAYMKQMDDELMGSNVVKNFPLKKPKTPPQSTKSKSPGANSIDLENDDFTPVNIDKCVVSNLLESYWSETGNPGPASALLHSLKVFPPSSGKMEELDSDDDEDDE